MSRERVIADWNQIWCAHDRFTVVGNLPRAHLSVSLVMGTKFGVRGNVLLDMETKSGVHGNVPLEMGTKPGVL